MGHVYRPLDWTVMHRKMRRYSVGPMRGEGVWLRWSGAWSSRKSLMLCIFFFSSRRRHTRFDCDWSSDVCSSDLTGRVFPFRFCGKPHSRTEFSGSPFAKLDGVLVANVDHWQVGIRCEVVFCEDRILWALIAAVFEECEVLPVGYFASTHSKRFELHAVLRPFASLTIVITHHENATRNRNGVKK